MESNRIKKRTFFVLHNDFSFSSVKKGFLEKRERICGILIHGKKKPRSDWVDAKKWFRVWEHEDILDMHSNTDQVEAGSTLVCLFDKILSDPRTFYIAERTLSDQNFYKINSSEGSFGHSWRVQFGVINALSIMRSTSPERILVQTTPHGLETWVFCKTAEFLGIPVDVIRHTPLPWRFCLGHGIDAQEIDRAKIVSIPNEIQEEAQCSNRAVQYINKLRGDYQVAKPGYEKDSEKRYGKKLWSAISEAKIAPKDPRKWPSYMLDSLHKRRRVKEYIRNLSDSDIAHLKPYIVLFLHYQPERTSLPEGKSYSQQWKAALALAKALPKSWSLLVKEHPSIFKKALRPWVRPTGYYRSFAQLRNTHLVRNDVDSFSLIDGAEAVATLTGTVGFEAICRGKPAITFGDAPYNSFPGVFRIESFEDLNESLKTLREGKLVIDRASILRGVGEVERYSYGAPEEAVLGTEGVNEVQMAMENAILSSI